MASPLQARPSGCCLKKDNGARTRLLPGRSENLAITRFFKNQFNYVIHTSATVVLNSGRVFGRSLIPEFLQFSCFFGSIPVCCRKSFSVFPSPSVRVYPPTTQPGPVSTRILLSS